MSDSDTGLALAVMDDDGWGCAITTEPRPAGTVMIGWSETRWYSAVIPLSDLEDAIGTRGPENDGHPLPANLAELAGDPFDHGDLNGLLCDLETQCTLVEVDNIEVGHVTAIKEGAS